jgi:hypothetical protein
MSLYQEPWWIRWCFKAWFVLAALLLVSLGFFIVAALGTIFWNMLGPWLAVPFYILIIWTVVSIINWITFGLWLKWIHRCGEEEG